jgi:uncharacterized protein (DUF433 family)
MNAANLITIDPDIVGCTPAFKGTRVPVKALCDYLADDLAVSVLRFSQDDIGHQAAA